MSIPRQQSTPATLAFAAMVAFGCALVVSLAVWWLKPIQLALVATDYTRAILEAAGVAQAEDALTERELARRFCNSKRAWLIWKFTGFHMAWIRPLTITGPSSMPGGKPGRVICHCTCGGKRVA